MSSFNNDGANGNDWRSTAVGINPPSTQQGTSTSPTGEIQFRPPRDIGELGLQLIEHSPIFQVYSPVSKKELEETPYEVGKRYLFSTTPSNLNGDGAWVIEAEVLKIYKNDLKIRCTHVCYCETKDRKSIAELNNNKYQDITFIIPVSTILAAEDINPQEEKKGDRIDNVIKNTNRK